jgi:chaperonin GroES
MSTSIRPLHDKVLVRRADKEQKTAGGIILTEAAAEKPQSGTVVAVGEGKRNDQGQRMKPDVKVGDKVLFGRYAGTEVKLNNEELLMMSEADIMAIVEG